MKTENVSTLKVHKLTQAQYDREEKAGTLDEYAIYITPDEEIDLSPYATVEQLNSKASVSHTHDTIQSGLGAQAALYFDDTTNKNHFFKPHVDYPTTREINLGSINTRTWDRIYAGTGVYVNGTACSLEGHTHDNRYYTETEVNNLLAGKSNASHTHDDRYYTETEVNNLLSAKSSTSHTHWYLRPNGSGSNTAMMTSGGNFYPYANEGQQLGTTASRWSWVMCKAVDESSDERKKENFSTDMDKYVAMLDLLEPTSYHFKSEVSDEDRRRNVGYIAQRVQEAMVKAGLEDKDFGGLHYDEEGESKGEYTYGLAYSQFIPILHAKIKQLEEKYNTKLEEYDTKIAELNEKLAALAV